MPHKQAAHNDLMQNRASLTKFAWLSIVAAVEHVETTGARETARLRLNANKAAS